MKDWVSPLIEEMSGLTGGSVKKIWVLAEDADGTGILVAVSRVNESVVQSYRDAHEKGMTA